MFTIPKIKDYSNATDIINENKVYVNVSAFVDTEGNVYPISFVWEDGNTYTIDKITEIRPAASLKAGGFGVRYSIKVRNQQTYIWYEENRDCRRWFLERK